MKTLSSDSTVASPKIIPWEADARTMQFTFVGNQAESLLGFPVDQWYEAEFWSDHMHADDREQALETCKLYSAGKESYEFEYRMIDANGKIVWLHDVVDVEWADGAPAKLKGFMIDITERKRNEQEFQRLLEFEQALVNIFGRYLDLGAGQTGNAIRGILGEIVLQLGFQRGIVVEFVGRTKDLYRTVSFVSHRADTQLDPLFSIQYPWFTDAIRAGRRLVMSRIPEDVPREAPEDRVAWEGSGLKSVTMIPLSTGGKALGALILETFGPGIEMPEQLTNRLGILGNILAEMVFRRHSETLVNRSRRRSGRLLEASSDATLLAQRDGTITEVNEKLERMFGFDAGELIGKSVDTLVPARFRDTHRLELAKYGAQPTEKRLGGRGPLFGRRKDASEFPVEINLSPFQSELEILICCGVRNVTERLELEAETALLRDELAHIARLSSMGELAASIAHELNQPLTAIVSNAQAARTLLKRKDPDVPEVLDALSDISADGLRAGEVISKLRSFVKKDVSVRTAIRLNDSIEDVIHLLHSDIIIKNVAVSLDFAPDLPLVRADQTQVQQILLNLILNAFEAMKLQKDRTKNLTIRTRSSAATEIEISVIDNGVGIARSMFPVLFDPFHTTRAQGMGLGLTITRTFIESHGGEIVAENNPEHGASFTFTLPVDEGVSG